MCRITGQLINKGFNRVSLSVRMIKLVVTLLEMIAEAATFGATIRNFFQVFIEPYTIGAILILALFTKPTIVYFFSEPFKEILSPNL